MKIITNRAAKDEANRLIGDTWLFYTRLRRFGEIDYRRKLYPNVYGDDNSYRVKIMIAKDIIEVLNVVKEYDRNSYEALVRYNRDELEEVIKFYKDSKEGD